MKASAEFALPAPEAVARFVVRPASGAAPVAAGAAFGCGVAGVAPVCGVACVAASFSAAAFSAAAFSAVDSKATTAADLQVEAKQKGQDIVIAANGGTTRVDAAPAVNGIPADVAIAATGEVPIPAHADTDPNYN